MVNFLILATVVLLGGCATAKLTINSDPPGAVVYYDGERDGYAPQTFTFDVDNNDKKRGYIELREVKVQWASGAKRTGTNLRLDLSKGPNQSIVVRRPENAPGLAVDQRFALELARTQAAQQQARALEAQAAAQARQATAQERQAAATEERARIERERRSGSTSVYCTSSVWGSVLSTSCY